MALISKRKALIRWDKRNASQRRHNVGGSTLDYWTVLLIASLSHPFGGPFKPEAEL